MGLNRIRIRKSIREHPFGDYGRSFRLWSFGRRKTLYPRLSQISSLFDRSPLSLSRSQRSQRRTFNRKSKSLAASSLPSINSFQTTKDYLLPFQTEANAYRDDASQGIIFGRGTANPFSLPRVSFPPFPVCPLSIVDWRSRDASSFYSEKRKNRRKRMAVKLLWDDW